MVTLPREIDTDETPPSSEQRRGASDRSRWQSESQPQVATSTLMLSVIIPTRNEAAKGSLLLRRLPSVPESVPSCVMIVYDRTGASPKRTRD